MDNKPSRAKYSGRRVRSAKRDKNTNHTGTMAIQLAVCAVILLTLWAVKTWFPTAANAVSGFIDTSLTSSSDYRAALGALGKTLSGEGSISEVWVALKGNSEAVSADNTSEPVAIIPTPPTPENGSGGGYYAEKYDSRSKLGMVEDALYGGDEDESDTSTVYLTTEDDEDEEELTGLVSYEFLAPEFDYITPLNGTKTSGFGYRIHPITRKNSFHYGVDIAAASGTVISAFADGTVELVGYNSVYGNYLFLRHKDGFITFYGHCKKISVTEGQLVLMGDTVATVGSSGWSTGPHLHFEVRSGETILDPMKYITLS